MYCNGICAFLATELFRLEKLFKVIIESCVTYFCLKKDPNHCGLTKKNVTALETWTGL